MLSTNFFFSLYSYIVKILFFIDCCLYCDNNNNTGISFVKIDDETVAREYGVDHIPTLVYFEKKIPSLYHGDLKNEEQVLAWLVEQLTSDMIEDVTDEMLDKLIKKSTHLAVLFCE